MGWWNSVSCDSFRDETDSDVKTLGNNVRDISYGDKTYRGVSFLYPIIGGEAVTKLRAGFVI
jgi:hypothetical protein